MQAALKGAQEIGFTVLSMSISLIAVFIPILMMSGIVGRLFREFAMVLSVGDRGLDGGFADGHSDDVRVAAAAEARPRCALQLDRKVLSVDHFHVCIGARRGAESFRAHLVVILYDGHQRLSLCQDSQRILPAAGHRPPAGQRVGQQHISYQALVEKAKWFEEQVRTDPDVETVDMVAGTSGGGFGGNQANIQVQLKPVGVRKSDDGRGDRAVCAARPPACPARPCSSRTRRMSASAGGRATPSISTRCRRRTSTRSNGGRKFSNRLSTLPEIADVSSDQQNSGLVVERRHRPRYRVAPRPDRAGGGLGALRCLRPAPGLGDVQVDQPVPRGSGAAAAMVGESGLSEDDLRADAQGHRRSFVDVYALYAGQHADLAAPPGTVPGQHDFVQSAGGRRR